MTRDSPVQPTPDSEPAENDHMTSAAGSSLQSGSISGGAEAPMQHGLENSTENAVSKHPNTTAITQGTVESLDNSKTTDGADKGTISLAWRRYTRKGKEPSTVKTWLLPWAMCRTWKGLIETMKNALVKYPHLIEDIEDENFEIERKDGVTIMPQFWELLAEPNCNFNILFGASSLSDHPPASSSSSSSFSPILRSRRSGKKGKHKTKFPPPPPPPPPAPAMPFGVDSQPLEIPRDAKSKLSIYDYGLKYTVHFSLADRYGIQQLKESFEEPIKFGQSEEMDMKTPVVEEYIELIRSSKYKLAPPPPLPPPPPPPPMGMASYQPRRKHAIMYPDDRITARRLIVHSPLLLNALRAVVEYSAEPPSGLLDCLQDGEFPFPYRDLYYHKEDLIQYKTSHLARSRHSDEYNTECDRHIDVLIKFLYDVKEIQLREVEDRWNMKKPSTTFSSLWLLLKPGSDVYVFENGRYGAYVIESSTGGPFGQEYAQPYTIRIWNLCYDGNTISRRDRKIIISAFDGEREIQSLPLFPVKFYQDEPGKQTLREQLIMRGRTYFELSKGPAFREYSGRGLQTGTRNYKGARVVVVYRRSRMVTSSGLDPLTPPRLRPEIDFDDIHPKAVVHQLQPPPQQLLPPRPPQQQPQGPPQFGTKIGSSARIASCQCADCQGYRTEHPVHVSLTFSSYDDIEPATTQSLTEHQYFLCDSQLWAFILKDRLYDRLDVSGIREPRINIHAIDRLVMKAEGNKALIKAICQSYSSVDHQHKPFGADFIKGKGEGQIILLHGPPGTGKTLTAESVAEFTKRPLLSITAADLGHDPVTLEQNLLTFFRDADEWDAIVLLDEADVYMERRSNNDLSRNSVVSVFLRALEYFQGILFLTTNRVGQFDEAFMSRVHLQIGYDALDEHIREKIWDNNFRKLQEDYEQGGREIRYEWAAKEYVQKSAEVKELQWNGREIRNAFQTAVDLALYDAKGKDIPFVKESHLKKVVNMSRAFKEYMKATHEDLDDSEMAYRSGLRDDRKKHGDISGN